jgi:hypothetical protein
LIKVRQARRPTSLKALPLDQVLFNGVGRISVLILAYAEDLVALLPLGVVQVKGTSEEAQVEALI